MENNIQLSATAQAILDEYEVLNQFLFAVYYTHPPKDAIRLVLDDGSIKMWIKRDKFTNIITKILNDTLLPEAQRVLYDIKLSLNSYGKLYYFDRQKLIFRELYENVVFENIRPNELIEAAREPLLREKITDNFKQVRHEYEDHLTKFTFNQPIKEFQKLITVIRNWQNKKKKKFNL